jgi:hypothetical protein
LACFGLFRQHRPDSIKLENEATSTYRGIGARGTAIDDLINMKPQPDTSTQEVLAGLVERVTYHNVENGFCVLRAKVRGHRDVIDQNRLHRRIWCALRHLPTFSGPFSALFGSNHRPHPDWNTAPQHRTVRRRTKAGERRTQPGKCEPQ